MMLPVCTGPLSYTGQDEIQHDIDNLRAGLKAVGTEAAGFLCSIGPGSASRVSQPASKLASRLLERSPTGRRYYSRTSRPPAWIRQTRSR